MGCARSRGRSKQVMMSAGELGRRRRSRVILQQVAGVEGLRRMVMVLRGGQVRVEVGRGCRRCCSRAQSGRACLMMLLLLVVLEVLVLVLVLLVVRHCSKRVRLIDWARRIGTIMSLQRAQ